VGWVVSLVTGAVGAVVGAASEAGAAGDVAVGSGASAVPPIQGKISFYRIAMAGNDSNELFL